MKALLISESDEILNSYAAFFKKAGYDTVCYRWLLKAMDNLEEIEPQLVFIDGFGYPRHWKTLAQYIKTSFKNAPLVLLAADLSEEETKKADCLDVHCIRGSIEDEQTRRNILSLLHPEQELEAPAEPVEEIEEPEVPATAPIQTAEPAAFGELSEELEQIDAQPFFAVPAQTSLSGSESVSVSAEKPAELAAAPGQPEVEPAEQSVELIAATEPAEFAESIETPGSAETVFEEPEPIDNEPFFKAVQPLSEQSAEPVDRQPAESENTEEVEHTAAIGERSNEDEAFSFTFFHPRTKTAIYGSTVSFKPPLLYFKPDDSSVLRTLRFGQKSSGVINDKGLASDVSVQIQGFENDSIELCLLK